MEAAAAARVLCVVCIHVYMSIHVIYLFLGVCIYMCPATFVPYKSAEYNLRILIIALSLMNAFYFVNLMIDKLD